MVIDKAKGRVDLRFNPMSSLDDYYIPVRGGESGTKIETLAGGQNTAAVEDVEYIQKKLFAALKIPKAYLGYDEEIGSKSTLAQEDIRFSRTIQRIQKTVLAELNKLAMIHLYSHGYSEEDLLDFEIKLSNPSVLAPPIVAAFTTSKTEMAAALLLVSFAKFAACLMTFHISKSLLVEQPSVPRETLIFLSLAFTQSNAPLASFEFDPGQWLRLTLLVLIISLS